jgi:hypothetical protein
VRDDQGWIACGDAGAGGAFERGKGVSGGAGGGEKLGTKGLGTRLSDGVCGFPHLHLYLRLEQKELPFMEANKKFSGWFRWMSLIVLAGSSVLLFLAAKPQSNKFSKYKSIEAYEVRPGILMMPRYTEDGQVCEIGLEKRHYMPERINLDSLLLLKDVYEIADELVPSNERGPRKLNTQGPYYTENSIYHDEIYMDYENVSIERVETVAAVIKWKNRKCQ